MANIDDKAIQFIVGELKNVTDPNQIIDTLITELQVPEQEAVEAVQMIMDEMAKGPGGGNGNPPKGQEQEQGQQGAGNADAVIAVLDKFQIPPEAAVALLDAIMKLNKDGLKALMQVLEDAMSQGQEGPPQEGQSQQDPMANV